MDRREQILELHSQGLSLREIGRRLGISHVAVLKRLKRLKKSGNFISGDDSLTGNLEEKEIGETPMTPPGWSDRDVAIWQLHQEGKKVKEISRISGMREDWLHKKIAWLIRDVERDSSI